MDAYDEGYADGRREAQLHTPRLLPEHHTPRLPVESVRVRDLRRGDVVWSPFVGWARVYAVARKARMRRRGRWVETVVAMRSLIKRRDALTSRTFDGSTQMLRMGRRPEPVPGRKELDHLIGFIVGERSALTWWRSESDPSSVKPQTFYRDVARMFEEADLTYHGEDPRCEQHYHPEWMGRFYPQAPEQPWRRKAALRRRRTSQEWRAARKAES